MTDFRLKLSAAALTLKLRLTPAAALQCRVTPGTQGPQGLQGLTGLPGLTGAAATIAVGTTSTLAPGSPATVANAGSSSAAVFNFGIPQGTTGAAGTNGATGPTGPTTALEWLFDTTTADADPGSGNLRFNNATFGSITTLFFDNNERNGTDVSTWLDAFDDSTTSALRGFLVLVKVTDTTVFRIFSVTGAVVNGTGYRKVPVSPIVSAGALATSDRVSVLFARTGDKGADGVGTGDVVGPAASVDSEIALFSSTTGKLLKRATGTGFVKATSGVYSVVSSIVGGDLATNTVTYSKIQQSAASTLHGNPTGALADMSEITLNATLSFTGTTLQRAALTGDVTATAGSNATTIANTVVTYAKMQNISATARILGRKTAAAGSTEECTLSQVLDFVGSAADGDVLYRSAGAWTRLPIGSATNVLTVTGGVPVWAASAGGASAGMSIQTLQTTYTAVTSLTVGIPLDDTIPQSTEGTQILSQAITPAASANKVLCIFTGFGSADRGSVTGWAAALFRSSTCIAAAYAVNGDDNGTSIFKDPSCQTIVWLDSPATASAVTYSVRVGATSTFAMQMNSGQGGPRYFGGVAAATLTLQEIKG